MKVLTDLTRITTVMLAFIAAFYLTACTNTADTAADEAVAEVEEAITPTLNDAQIAHIVVVANQIDVNYGKIALEKATDDEARNFAETMIKDHEAIIAAATDLAGKLGVTPEDNDVSQSLLDGEIETTAMLNGLDGEAFNKAYIDNEVAYHDAVISAVKDLLIPQTENEELKQTLIDVTPLLEHHFEMAKMAQDKLK